MPGGPGVRVDTFAHSECTIPPYYDSMIAKIIVHGRDRQEAIARMRRTLEMTVIEGIKTSIPLHLKILAEPDFVAGRLSTAFMERYIVEKKAEPASPRRSDRRAVSRLPSSTRSSTPTSAQRAGLDPAAVADACLRGGAPLLQLRDKSGVERRASSSWPSAWSPSRTRRGARVIVNDRADIARAVGADGVHVGQDDLAVAEVRRDRRALTRSSGSRRTRASRSIARSQSDASYIAVGPIFATATKDTGYDARGLDLVRCAAGRGQAGRRDRRDHAGERAPEVIAAGASAVAVITDLLPSGDLGEIEARVRAFVRALPARPFKV